MNKFIISVSVLVGSVGSLVQATHPKVLNMEADSYQSKLWVKAPITEEEIIKSLHFIKDPNSLSEQYKTKDIFEMTFNKATLMSSEMKSFAELCKGIYDKDPELRIRSSIHLLLEKTMEKHEKDLKLQQKKERHEKLPSLEPVSRDTLTRFLNPDKLLRKP